MLRYFAAALILAASATSGMAQTATPSGAEQMTGPNSGAGVPGQPGNKSGPAVKSPSGTTGAGAGSSQAPTNDVSHPQDASKVPGLPGNKSGPAVKSPSSSGR